MLLGEKRIQECFRDIGKFVDVDRTQKGDRRASVEFEELKTLWLNTGTLCNLSCPHCYIESSPKNDELAYLSVDDVAPFLSELEDTRIRIGLTGGEPFLNPSIEQIMSMVLERGHELLVLTNALGPMMRKLDRIVELDRLHPGALSLRVSFDHHTEQGHDEERGVGNFQKSLANFTKLAKLGLRVSIAGRAINESVEQAVQGYRQLFESLGVGFELKMGDNAVIFPEMSFDRDVPEITEQCWSILNVSPSSMMCATERMVVKRKGEEMPVVLPCTLLAYDRSFEYGHTLESAKEKVSLNHPFCAQFCVLGGASCSSTS